MQQIPEIKHISKVKFLTCEIKCFRMQIGPDLGHGTLGLINVRKEILWEWTRYIKGNAKYIYMNENLSMAMYALVHKL
jgi:hypothetical protein